MDIELEPEGGFQGDSLFLRLWPIYGKMTFRPILNKTINTAEDSATFLCH